MKICPPHLNNVFTTLFCENETITFHTHNALLEYETKAHRKYCGGWNVHHAGEISSEPEYVRIVFIQALAQSNIITYQRQ